MLAHLGGSLLRDESGRRGKHEYVADGSSVTESFSDLDAVIPLPEIEVDLPLRAIYDGAELT